MPILHAVWKFSFTAIIVLIVITTILFVIANIIPTHKDASGNTVSNGFAIISALIGGIFLIVDIGFIPIFVIIGVVSFILDKLLSKPEDRQRELNKLGQVLREPGTGSGSPSNRRPPENNSNNSSPKTGGKRR